MHNITITFLLHALGSWLPFVSNAKVVLFSCCVWHIGCFWNFQISYLTDTLSKCIKRNKANTTHDQMTFLYVTDVVLDVDTLTDDQIEQLNACGTQFGMGKKDYIK